MIAATGNAGLDASLLARLTGNSNTVKRQLDVALQQEGTGKISDAYAGLGTGLRTSLDLRPALQHLQTWQDNIDSATSRLDVTQSALSQISAIAQDYYAKTNNINGIGVSEVSSIAVTAKQALQQVAQLLNSKAGNIYVFAGQDTDNPPVPNTDPVAVGADLLASDTATPPFSATLGTAAPTVEVGDGQRLQVGLLANANTLSTSTAPTTGSYMRDVMRALATLANLVDGPTAQATAADVRTRLHSAIGAMADETGALGDIQSGLAARKITLAATQTAADKQVSNAEDVDMAATLTKIASLQTQLQASYQLISGAKGLSLSSYL